jgi:hypothetical protein
VLQESGPRGSLSCIVSHRGWPVVLDHENVSRLQTPVLSHGV